MTTARTRVAAAVAAGCLLAGCGTSTGTATSSTPSTSTPTSTTSAPSTTPGPGSAVASGPCSVLTVTEIATATGKKPDDASEVRGGCRWEQTGSTPVLDFEVEKLDGDVAHRFATEKTVYGDPSLGNPGVGEDSFFSSTDQGQVYWLQHGVLYDIWIQSSTVGTAERAHAVELAKTVSRRI